MRKYDLQKTIDTGLSDLMFSDHHKRVVFAAMKGEKVVKRKVSIGFVIIIVLVMFALGALAAALLSGKEFVEQVLAPKLGETTSDQWTKDEIETINRIAKEYGIELSKDIVNELEKSEGQHKEELLRLFLKSDLGFYPATWSIEDQAWYDELLFKAGFVDARSRYVPRDKEMSYDEALSICYASIKDDFGNFVDVSDAAAFQQFVEYRIMTDQEGNLVPCKWYIRFEALSSVDSSYNFVINSSGGIEASSEELGIKSADGATNAESVFDHYAREYGIHYEWSQNTWVMLQRDLECAVEKNGHTGKLSTILLRQHYGTPDLKSISIENAITIAKQEISKASNISMAELAQYESGALYLVEASWPIWKVRFFKTSPAETYTFALYYAEVNAYTGEVLNTGFYQPGKNDWYEAYVLIDTMQDDNNYPSYG